MGRHRRTAAGRAAMSRAAGTTGSQSTDGYTGETPSHDRAGQAFHGNDRAYDTAESDAYLYAVDGSAGDGSGGDGGAADGNRNRKGPSGPVRTGLLGISVAVALGVVAVTTGVLPGGGTFNFTGEDRVQSAAGTPTSSVEPQGGTDGPAKVGPSHSPSRAGKAPGAPAVEPSRGESATHFARPAAPKKPAATPSASASASSPRKPKSPTPAAPAPRRTTHSASPTHKVPASPKPPTATPTHKATTPPKPTPTHEATTQPTATPTHKATIPPKSPTAKPTHKATTPPKPPKPTATPTHEATTPPKPATPTPTHTATTQPKPPAVSPSHAGTTAPKPPTVSPTTPAAPTASASAAAPSKTTVSADAAEAEVLRLVNDERAKAGCVDLTSSSSLNHLAEKFSADMKARGFFGHTDPGGRTPWDRATQDGIGNLGAENIARGQFDAKAVVDAWMASPAHRANILNCQYRTAGVGVVLGSGGPWWTGDFGF
ncbi:CAP domain-containing protein [Streptomyces sp. NPDC002004]